MATKVLRDNIMWPAVGLGSLVWLMSVSYGMQYLFVGKQHELYFRVVTIPFAAAIAFLTWHALARGSIDRTEIGAPWWLGLLMMSVSFGLGCFFYSAQLAPIPWPVPVVAVPFAAYLCHRKWGYRGANAAFLAGTAVVFLHLLRQVPQDLGGDMLQIIEFASKDLLAGEIPYRPYLTSSGKEVPFGYWPGVWIPYVPFVGFGVDMRALNLLAFALLVILFETASSDRTKVPETLSLTFYPFILSSQVWQMVLFGHLWLYWLLVCATLLLVAHERLGWAALLFGLCLASRPTALFLAGPIAAYVWTRHGATSVLKSAITAIFVVVLANFPLAMLYGQDFWNNSYARMIGFGQDLEHLSLAGYLQSAGLLWLGNPIQVVIILSAMMFLILRRPVRPATFVLVSGITFAWLMLFNSYATRYVYFPGFFLIALGLVLAFGRQAGTQSVELQQPSSTFS